MDNQINKILLKELVGQATKYLTKLGYSPVSVYYYNLIWRHLLKYADAHKVKYFTLKFGWIFLEKICGIQDISHLSKPQKQKIRTIKVLNDFIVSHSLSRYYRINSITIPMQFITLYNAYSDYINEEKQKEKTITTKLSRIKTFFDFLDKKGIREIDSVTKSDILDFLSFLNSKYTSNARSNILFTLREFLKYSSETGQAPHGLNNMFPVIYTNKHERLPSFYSKEELNNLLDSVNRKTITGKKDYAILLLAIELGMRASDINNLIVDNIKWEKKTIEFFQQKTGIHIKLPFTDTIKFALLDYLKNSRPNTSYRNVFVRQVAPHIPFANGTAFYNIINKYMNLAGISTEGKRHGLHSLRHSLAGNLLNAKTPIPIISGILGHSSTEITNRYLWIDIDLLRTVSLEVSNEK